MTDYNLILLLNPSGSHVLMLKRTRPPYLGLYNLPGGHIEPGEGALQSAHRELFEETGIDGAELFHLMDFTYPHPAADCRVRVYAGKLTSQPDLVEEAHPLTWMPICGENFFSMDKYGGEGNIGHMLEILKLCQPEWF